ncbi:PRESEQUENCE PROTEASE [Salix purpurea]|uniref:PRESEQUENCE PROTEASE n=1 Tax=Salix purpurea TaxID=77065 RepID=A0A9Q0SWZ9_SALPP|nr:PRESEQUENCE PROTEASE [Salix purpurea]
MERAIFLRNPNKLHLLPRHYSPATSLAFSPPHLSRHDPHPSPVAFSTVRLAPSPLAPSSYLAAVDFSLSLIRHTHRLSTSTNTTSLLPLLTPSPPNALQVLVPCLMRWRRNMDLRKYPRSLSESVNQKLCYLSIKKLELKSCPFPMMTRIKFSALFFALRRRIQLGFHTYWNTVSCVAQGRPATQLLPRTQRTSITWLMYTWMLYSFLNAWRITRLFNRRVGILSSTILQKKYLIKDGTAQLALFPDNTYGVDSGGDPKVIPKLTFEQFKEFHGKYYHPSNARIWFYGDDDPTERLCILSEYLDMFDASSASNESRIEQQKFFSEPVRIVEKYPAGDGSDLKKKHMVCLNWLLADKPLDLETELTLGFLDHLMLGTPASPLTKILLDSGLGDAIVGGGVEDELLQPQFSIGLKGVSKEDIEKVEELVMGTLKKLAEEGFETDAVEASMNTIEFSLRENNTGSFPRGLSLMLQSISKWIYDMDPFEPFKV